MSDFCVAKCQTHPLSGKSSVVPLKFLREIARGLPWVPEAILARFPVAAYVLYCDPREKPLDQSASALMTPSQWLACLDLFSPEFGSGC